MTLMSIVNGGDVEGKLAKRLVGWFIAVGAALAFAAGMWLADTTASIRALERSAFTKEDAASLRNSIDLLTRDIQYLRVELDRLGAGTR